MSVWIVWTAVTTPSIPQSGEDRNLALGAPMKTIEVTQKTVAAVPAELEALGEP